MSTGIHPTRRQGSYNLSDSLSGAGSTRLTAVREFSSSTSGFSGHDHGSSTGFGENGKLGTFNLDSAFENTKITMQTRVAVRNKTPHRFQVVPLRDVGKLSNSTACQVENSSRLKMPTTPKKHLRTPSRKLGTPSQTCSRQSDLSPLNSISKGTRQWEGTVDLELTMEKALMQSPDIKNMLSSRPRPATSSLPIAERNIILAEWDLNQEHKRNAIRNSQEARLTPIKISHKSTSMSIDSIHQIISSDSPLTQTISRSLQCRTPSKRNHPKYTSLSNIQPPVTPQASSLPNINAVEEKDSTLSGGNHKCRETEDDSYYALLDAYETSDSTSTKRHAIYTPSLYVPYFDQSSQLQGTEGSSSRLGSSLVEIDAQDSNKDPSIGPQSHITVCQERIDVKSGPDNDSERRLEHSFDISDTRSMNWLLADRPSQDLKHKSSSRSLPLRLPRGLNYSKPSRSLHYTGMGDGSRPGEMVYPRIVLGLFADLDKAVEEWSH